MTTLKIEVDCEPVACGNCRFLRNAGDRIIRDCQLPPWCEVWPGHPPTDTRFLRCDCNGLACRHVHCLNAEVVR